MSGLNSLLLHVILITPVCQYLLTSPKFPKPRNFIFAITFLVAVALAGEVSEWQSRPPNYYRILDVDRSCTPSELKKSYREATLKYHPDKNKSPEAPMLFQAATEAYETLNDVDLRKLYERYGSQALKDARTRAVHLQRSESELFMGLASFYIMWSVLTYLMTIGKSRSQARVWSFVGLIVSLGIEFQIVFGGWDPLSSILTRTTLQEKIELIHSLYPAFMHGCILLSQFTFVDLDALQLLLLQTVLQQQRELSDLVKHVVQCVDKKHGAAIAAAGGATEVAAGSGGSGGGAGSGVGEESLTLAQRIKRQETATAKAISDASQKSQKGGIPGWVVMIGMYVVFNYLLK